MMARAYVALLLLCAYAATPCDAFAARLKPGYGRQAAWRRGEALRMAEDEEGAGEKKDWFRIATRLYHEVVPWGDWEQTYTKQMAGSESKHRAMVKKFMDAQGCTREEAIAEVEAYLNDKEGSIARKRAEEEGGGAAAQSGAAAEEASAAGGEK